MGLEVHLREVSYIDLFLVKQKTALKVNGEGKLPLGIFCDLLPLSFAGGNP